jgi:hypothetical protein
MTDLMKEWEQATQEASTITVDELDSWAAKWVEAFRVYEEYKKTVEEECSRLFKEADAIEGKFVEALTQAGRKEYLIEGKGTAHFKARYSVQTPKSIEDKQALARYLEQKGGKEYFWTQFGVNSMTLQSLYKNEQKEFEEKAKAAGEATQFVLPGVGVPTAKITLELQKPLKKRNG